MNKYVLLLLSLSFFSIQTKLLKLPSYFSQTALFYVKTGQLNSFCCGYNALYNGCRLEKHFGFNNPYSGADLFKKTCLRYIRPLSINPKNAVDNKTLIILAEGYLRMQKIHFLHFNDYGEVQPSFSTATEIMHDADASQYEINELFRQANVERTKKIFHDLEKDLEKNRHKTKIIHFICHVRVGEDHAIMISLVQNHTGRALYIFDNLNSKIDRNSDACVYINYLCDAFLISTVNQFKAPKLPDIWN